MSADAPNARLSKRGSCHPSLDRTVPIEPHPTRFRASALGREPGCDLDRDLVATSISLIATSLGLRSNLDRTLPPPGHHLAPTSPARADPRSHFARSARDLAPTSPGPHETFEHTLADLIDRSCAFARDLAGGGVRQDMRPSQRRSDQGRSRARFLALAGEVKPPASARRRRWWRGYSRPTASARARRRLDFARQG